VAILILVAHILEPVVVQAEVLITGMQAVELAAIVDRVEMEARRVVLVLLEVVVQVAEEDEQHLPLNATTANPIL
jgi:hypothetical protein